MPVPEGLKVFVKGNVYPLSGDELKKLVHFGRFEIYIVQEKPNKVKPKREKKPDVRTR